MKASQTSIELPQAINQLQVNMERLSQQSIGNALAIAKANHSLFDPDTIIKHTALHQAALSQIDPSKMINQMTHAQARLANIDMNAVIKRVADAQERLAGMDLDTLTRRFSQSCEVLEQYNPNSLLKSVIEAESQLSRQIKALDKIREKHQRIARQSIEHSAGIESDDDQRAAIEDVSEATELPIDTACDPESCDAPVKPNLSFLDAFLSKDFRDNQWSCSKLDFLLEWEEGHDSSYGPIFWLKFFGEYISALYCCHVADRLRDMKATVERLLW